MGTMRARGTQLTEAQRSKRYTMYAARQSKRNEEISEINGSVMHPSGAEGAEAVDLVAHRSARVAAASPRLAV